MRTRTALIIAGVVFLLAVATEVLLLDRNGLINAVEGWGLVALAMLAAVPRRGPEDELWIFGVVRELRYRSRRRWRRGLGGTKVKSNDHPVVVAPRETTQTPRSTDGVAQKEAQTLASERRVVALLDVDSEREPAAVLPNGYSVPVNRLAGMDGFGSAQGSPSAGPNQPRRRSTDGKK